MTFNKRTPRKLKPKDTRAERLYRRDKKINTSGYQIHEFPNGSLTVIRGHPTRKLFYSLDEFGIFINSDLFKRIYRNHRRSSFGKPVMVTQSIPQEVAAPTQIKYLHGKKQIRKTRRVPIKIWRIIPKTPLLNP